MNRPALVLFAYKRPEHTRRTLEALARCRGATESDLYVYSDGPKGPADQDAVTAVREIVRAPSGFRSVCVNEAVVNQGLAASVIAGVGQVLELHDSCIVVEDDLELSIGFIEFLTVALTQYRDETLVFSLSGYAPPHHRVRVEPADSVWFAPRPSSWGWAIWKDRWDKVDWTVADRGVFETEVSARRRFELGGRDLSYFLRLQLRGQLDSWAVRLAWSQSRAGGLTLYPARSFVANRGLDGSGTHSLAQADQDIDLTEALVPTVWPRVYPAPVAILRQFRRHYEGTWTERWGHRWRKLVRWFGSKSR